MNVYDSTGQDLRARDIVYLADDKEKQEFSITHIDGQEIVLMDKQGNTIKDLAQCVIRINHRAEKSCQNCRHWCKITARDPNSEGLVGKGICVMTASEANRPVNGNHHQTTAFAYQSVKHLDDSERRKLFTQSAYLITEPEHYCSMYEVSGFRNE